MILIAGTAHGQSTKIDLLSGVVRDAQTGQPVEGVTVEHLDGESKVLSSKLGEFQMKGLESESKLRFSHMSYSSQTVIITKRNAILEIMLIPISHSIDDVEVYSTGYYNIPKERVTGSFTHIDSELFNRSTSPDIMSRLENVAPGLGYVRRGMTGEGQQKAEIRIRGIGSIFANNAPLVVIDGFPYDGDIELINPNDVRDVTLLKDAAAASIWGARAGNGVIVINTHSGYRGSPLRIDWNSGVTLGQKMDFRNSSAFIPASSYLDFEDQAFEAGLYSENNRDLLSSYVELLIKRRDNEISENEFSRRRSELALADIRDDASRYLYRRPNMQQYGLALSGDASKINYRLSFGLDQSAADVKHNEEIRYNVLNRLKYTINNNLSLDVQLGYSHRKAKNNGLSLSDILPVGKQGIFSYARLINEDGTPASVPREFRTRYIEHEMEQGLPDWFYYPMDEISQRSLMSKNNEMQLNVGLNYKRKGFDALLSYHLSDGTIFNENIYEENSYHVRSLSNKYTDANGVSAVPPGGIYTGDESARKAYVLRGQMGYNFDIAQHNVVTLAGAEVKQHRTHSYPHHLLYGFSPSYLTGQSNLDYQKWHMLRPQGIAMLPAPHSTQRMLTDRFLSYFANASYTYDSKYILSSSIRWDGSNLFGVNANQKGVPLWSIGGSWLLSKEQFFGIESDDLIKIRATYGHNGNTNPMASVYPIIMYSFNPTSHPYRTANLTNAGNPDLTWEKNKIFNVGVDFSFFNARVSGTTEFYRRNSENLLGDAFLNPTTGITEAFLYRINYADMLSDGIDVSLNVVPVKGKVTWSADLLYNFARNKITNYNSDNVNQAREFLINLVPPPVLGKSRDVVYALPYAGLDAQNGRQIVRNDEGVTDNYSLYYSQFPIANLIDRGTSAPRHFGAFRNTLHYGGFQMSVNISYKFDYVFRKRSVDYQGFVTYMNIHSDILGRWQKPGDEKNTTVPALSSPTSIAESQSYLYSDILVDNAGHLRIEDVNIAYSFSNSSLSKIGVKDLTLYMYAKTNKAFFTRNRWGVDPEYANTLLGQPKGHISFGIKFGIL